jgi:putative flippase GtrA
MIAAAAGLLAAMIRSTYLRYVAASVAALAIDVGSFLMAMAAGVPALLASAVGYAAGILVHWWLSSRTVFAAGLADRGTERRRQQVLFLLSAGVGLGITIAVVGIGVRAGIDPRLAKLVAIAVAFQTTYLLRRRIVFV